MRTPKEVFESVRNAALGTKPSTTIPNPLEATVTQFSPNHKLVAMLFEDCGEHKSPDAKKLAGTLDASWLAAFDETKGHSHDDAIRSHKAARANFRAGKCKDVPKPRPEYIRENCEHRALLRQRAQIISTEAQHTAAACWERALAHVPEFRAKLESQEKAIFAATSEIGTSPLLRMIDALPAFMANYISKLKAASGNRRPGELIPKI